MRFHRSDFGNTNYFYLIWGLLCLIPFQRYNSFQLDSPFAIHLPLIESATGKMTISRERSYEKIEGNFRHQRPEIK